MQVRMRGLGWLICYALAQTACSSDLGDPGGGTESDGVLVYCENEQPAGDDTGGGVPYNGNYWWEMCMGFDCNDPDGDVVCYSDGISEVQYCKRYSFPDVAHNFPGVPICVGNDWPAAVDIYNGWMSGAYPSIDDEIRTACSDRCVSANAVNEDVWTNQLPALTPECDDSKWNPISTGAWEPPEEPNCGVVEYLNVADPDGLDIDWSLVGGSSTPIQLGCSLIDDCVDWFYPHVRPYVLTPREATVIDPETRTAHCLAEDDGNGVLDIDMSGSGFGIDDRESLFGFAEYTALDCGEDVCPFFLASFAAYNANDKWDIRVDTVLAQLEKRISDVQIDLVQSTLGVCNTVLDKVAFAPGALLLRVEFTVTSCGGCSSTFGNGRHVAVVENEEYVFANYDNGSLSVEHTFDLQSGKATLDITVDPVEVSPEASHDLAATEVCDDPGGLMLDVARSFSTDADNDIDFEMWWVDGEPCAHGCVIPQGSHEIALEVHDSRGAVHRTADEWVFVAAGPACTL